MSAQISLSMGARFGRLTVVASAPAKCGRTRVAVLCDCGVRRIVRTCSLLSGNTASCGCAHAPRSHGMTATRTYRIWCAMRARCAGQISPECYADRGISVCERWLSFENFLVDMGEAPEGHSLDRFPNNDGHYEPGNCRWATAAQQSRNRRTNVFIEHDGRRMCVADWATHYQVSASTITRRFARIRAEQKAKGTP